MTDQAETLRETLREINEEEARKFFAGLPLHGPDSDKTEPAPQAAELPTVKLARAARVVIDAYGLVPYGCVIKIDPRAHGGRGCMKVTAYVGWWQRFLVEGIVDKLTELLVRLLPDGWHLTVETTHVSNRGVEVLTRS